MSDGLRQVPDLLTEQLLHETRTLLWGVCVGVVASLPVALFIVRWGL